VRVRNQMTSCDVWRHQAIIGHWNADAPAKHIISEWRVTVRPSARPDALAEREQGAASSDGTAIVPSTIYKFLRCQPFLLPLCSLRVIRLSASDLNFHEKVSHYNQRHRCWWDDREEVPSMPPSPFVAMEKSPVGFEGVSSDRPTSREVACCDGHLLLWTTRSPSGWTAAKC
jgi:hypothetical protein